MAYAQSNKQRIAIKRQSSNWGTAETSFAAANVIECQVIYPDVSEEPIKPDVVTAGHYAGPVAPGAQAMTEITLTGPLMGVDSSTPTADPSEHPLSLLCALALGGTSADGYQTDLTSGGNTTSVPVTSGTDDHSGHGILVPLSSGHSWGWISQHTTNTYTVSTLSGTPASSGTILGSVTTYLQDVVAQESQPITLEWLGSDAKAKLTAWDALPSRLVLRGVAGQAPTFESTIMSSGYTRATSGGAPAPWSSGYPLLPAVAVENGARVTLAGSSYVVAEATITIDLAMAGVGNYGGTNGRAQLGIGSRTVTIELVRAMTDISDAGQPGDNPGVMQIDFCTTAGRACSVFVGNPVLVATKRIEDVGGLLGFRETYELHAYSGDTESTAPADTDFRIAWG